MGHRKGPAELLHDDEGIWTQHQWGEDHHAQGRTGERIRYRATRLAHGIDPQMGHPEMMGADQQEQTQHDGRSPQEGQPAYANGPHVGEGKGLSEWAFRIAVHVGVQDVVKGAVLYAHPQDEQYGQRGLCGGHPMPERIAEQGPGEQQAECPPTHLSGILEHGGTHHGTKERPTPLLGVGPISLLVVRGISCCCPSQPERKRRDRIQSC